jgi:hypothetical protein
MRRNMKMKLTRNNLKRLTKEELIQIIILRNGDAKDYEKYICKLEKPEKEKKNEKPNKRN